MNRHIALLGLITDYGNRDWFSAILHVKLIELGVQVPVVDVSHEVPPGDVERAAFLIWAFLRDVSVPCLLVVIVDPNVGSQRKIIVWEWGKHVIITPEGDFMKYVSGFSVGTGAAPPPHAYIPDTSKYEVKGGPTFHGRDIFMPLCADIIRGMANPLQNYDYTTSFSFLVLSKVGDGMWHDASIVYIDRFGNALTNVYVDIPLHAISGSFVFKDGNVEVRGPVPSYAYIEKGASVVVNSGNLLEIAMYRGSASAHLTLYPGKKLLFQWLK